MSLLYYLAMKFSTTKKILKFSYKFKNSFKTQVVSQYIDYCMIMCSDVYIVYRSRLTSKDYFYCSCFFLLLLFVYNSMRQWIHVTNLKYHIMIYKVHLKYLHLEKYCIINPITNNTCYCLCPSVFYTRVCLIGFLLIVFHCRILL